LFFVIISPSAKKLVYPLKMVAQYGKKIYMGVKYTD
jgi:hypothetical protein